jgi:hypothetical protein
VARRARGHGRLTAAPRRRGLLTGGGPLTGSSRMVAPLRSSAWRLKAASGPVPSHTGATTEASVMPRAQRRRARLADGLLTGGGPFTGSS